MSLSYSTSSIGTGSILSDASEDEDFDKFDFEELGNFEDVEFEIKYEDFDISDQEIECFICWEPCSIDDMYSLRCGDRYCKECIKEYVQNRLTTGFHSMKIPCPALEHCKLESCYELTIEDILAVATITEANKYLKYQEQKKHGSGNDNIRWCPSATCDTWIEITIGQKRATCPVCNTNFCTKSECQFPLHSKFNPCTFNQVMETVTSKEEMGAAVHRALWTKKCPNCNTSIEKNGGCHHMTCSHCNTTFCWRCGHDYSKGGNHCYRYKVPLIAGAVIAAPVWVPVGAVIVGGIYVADNI
eukprot:TRINITY_DN5008_c0_g1_i2.p1 TRINITY_DN5008_c0_g1~~TRINITY_DN5008_c0_g1_i2.p1  ORF type:complete len:300 (-),score=83.63 TRINITY_DN5008_c0_g1_i2:242-1141(-)